MAGMATCLSYGGSRECRWFARADRVSESTKFSPANADRERGDRRASSCTRTKRIRARGDRVLSLTLRVAPQTRLAVFLRRPPLAASSPSRHLINTSRTLPPCVHGRRLCYTTTTNVFVASVSSARGCITHTLLRRPQSRRDHPLNLSILLSGGKETNQDFLSSGERTGRSPAPNPAVPPQGNVVFGRVRLSRGVASRPSPS